MSRNEILLRLQRLVDRSDTTELPDKLPSFPVFEDPVKRFAEELTRVGGQFSRAGSLEELEAVLGEILKETGATEICWEGIPALEKHGIPYQLPDSNEKSRALMFSRHDQVARFPLNLETREYRKEDLAEIEVSVSSAICGIAETGTVVEQPGKGYGRALSFLPPNHVVLLSRKNLLGNHAEFFQGLPADDFESDLVMITGPSRTADIEKTLILGVHGPKSLSVILTP